MDQLERKEQKSVAILEAWINWKEKNKKVFNNYTLLDLIELCKQTFTSWSMAGAKGCACYFARS
jgi:hypothetical protein